jgi:hypothetical protein
VRDSHSDNSILCRLMKSLVWEGSQTSLCEIVSVSAASDSTLLPLSSQVWSGLVCLSISMRDEEQAPEKGETK